MIPDRSWLKSRWQFWTEDREQTPLEETWNTWSAALGLVLFLGAGFWFFQQPELWRNPVLGLGVLAFCVTCWLTHLASTLYHGARPATEEKRWFLLLDHSAILLLIAGSYTPFALILLTETAAWWLVGLEWVLAVTGLALLWWCRPLFQRVSVVFYLTMGWLGIFFAPALVSGVAPLILWLLLAGGLAYTFGVVFFLWKRLQFSHLVWHGFVLAGGVAHFLALGIWMVDRSGGMAAG
jgi:hemolysin III